MESYSFIVWCAHFADVPLCIYFPFIHPQPNFREAVSLAHEMLGEFTNLGLG